MSLCLILIIKPFLTIDKKIEFIDWRKGMNEKGDETQQQKNNLSLSTELGYIQGQFDHSLLFLNDV